MGTNQSSLNMASQRRSTTTVYKYQVRSAKVHNFFLLINSIDDNPANKTSIIQEVVDQV